MGSSLRFNALQFCLTFKHDICLNTRDYMRDPGTPNPALPEDDTA